MFIMLKHINAGSNVWKILTCKKTTTTKQGYLLCRWKPNSPILRKIYWVFHHEYDKFYSANDRFGQIAFTISPVKSFDHLKPVPWLNVFEITLWTQLCKLQRCLRQHQTLVVLRALQGFSSHGKGLYDDDEKRRKYSTYSTSRHRFCADFAT